MWQIIQIFWIDVLLSGDNAVVIALACRGLPEKQRRIGIWLGTAVAIGLRLAFVAVATTLLTIPSLKLIGGLLLLWIGIKLVIDETDAHDIQTAFTLMAAVRIIALADVVMSLDNIIAVAAAARDNMLLIVFGLLLSVPLIVFGAGLVMRVLDRHAWLVWAGAALLGYVAGDMIVADPLIAPQLTAWVGSVAGSIAPWLKPSLIHPLAGAVGIAIVLGLAALFHWRRAGHDTPSQQKA